MTLAGVLLALVMVVAAVVAGGEATRFLDLPSLLLVVGGTLAAGLATSDPMQLRVLVEMLRRTRKARADGAVDRYAVTRLVRLATTARQRGSLALERQLDQLADVPTFRRGLELVLNGSSPEAVQQTLRGEIGLRADRLMAVPALLARMAELAPGMGLIGTLVGLVQMLGHLDDPSTIGPGMALALVTTLYGAILAYVVLQPFAHRLEQQVEAEIMRMRQEAMAAISIARGESPLLLEDNLTGMVTAAGPARA